MVAETAKFPFSGVVIVADLIPDETTIPAHLRRDLEQTSQHTLDALRSAIERLGLHVTHYEHPRFLAENAEQHRTEIVLSIFGGEVSRSRMALVPAVCESMGLAYIGPDAYGRVTLRRPDHANRDPILDFREAKPLEEFYLFRPH